MDIDNPKVYGDTSNGGPPSSMFLFHRKHYFGPCLEKFYVVIFMDGPQRGGRRVISNLFLSKNLIRKVLDGLPYLMSQSFFPNNYFSL